MGSVEFEQPDDAQAGEIRAGVGLANLSGKQIGRYLIGQQLGTGGAATVYRAYDHRLSLDVAVKEFTPPPGLRPEELPQLREQFRGHRLPTDA